MYTGIEHGLARERAARMRVEVARNRRQARSAKVDWTDEDVEVPGGRVARGAATLLAALFGAQSAS